MYPKFVPHWIADVEVAPKDSTTFEKRNPATDQVIAQVARGGAAEVAHALSSAAGAAESGARTPVPKRGAILGRAAQLLREREKEFGEIVQAETGKPWKNAVAEVGLVRRPGDLHGRRGQPVLRQDAAEPDSESHRADAAQPDRHLRGDHAVQQPARRRRLEGVSGAAVRQRRRREVARADAVHRGRVRQVAEGCRACRSASTARCRALAPMPARRSSRIIASASSASRDRRRPAS